MAAKNAILKAKIEGVIYEMLVKTNAANVMVDDSTTLAAKLSSIIADIGTKANATHTHAQADVTGLEDALTARPTTDAMNTAISTAVSEAVAGLINGAPETYDTLKEIADYIEAHKSVETALNEAIGKKADKTTTDAIQASIDALGALAAKSKVAETDLDDELKAKVNAAAEGNHSHANKALLDTYDQTNADIKDAVTKKHSHANSTVLDGISAEKVAAWDAAEQNAKNYADGKDTAMNTRVTAIEGKEAGWDAKANVYYSKTEPAALAEGDLWFALVD